MGLKEARASLEIAGKVADRMARHLGWDDQEKQRQSEAYKQWVDRSMGPLG